MAKPDVYHRPITTKPRPVTREEAIRLLERKIREKKIQKDRIERQKRDQEIATTAFWLVVASLSVFLLFSA